MRLDAGHIVEAGGSSIGGSIRNIADTGTKAQMRGANITEFPATGAINNQKINAGGFISPLATAILCSANGTISTTSTGSFTITIRHDSNSHDVFRLREDKEGSGSGKGFNRMAEISFSKEQAFYITTGGSLAESLASGSCLCPSSDDLAQFGALNRGALASSVG